MSTDKINKNKIMSTISAVQSGRTSPSMGLKIIGQELKEGFSPSDAFKSAMKSGRTSTINRAKGGLVGKQKKLDKNKDGKITGADFKMMKKSKKKGKK